MEEQKRRNEASMRRKQQTLALTNGNTGSSDSAPPSPASTGAMDTLLAKLRAAAPDHKDQRERRRRARLKDRHQVRIASGQKVPELTELVSDKEGLVSPKSEASSEAGSTAGAAAGEGGESEDVADRAASLLRGLTGEAGAAGEGEGLTPSDSLRVRRRRESADSERERRRRRRAAASGSSEAKGSSEALMSPPIIAEEAEEEDGATAKAGDEEAERPEAEGDAHLDVSQKDMDVSTPVTIVSPPSPTQSEKGSKDPGMPTPPAD